MDIKALIYNEDLSVALVTKWDVIFCHFPDNFLQVQYRISVLGLVLAMGSHF